MVLVLSRPVFAYLVIASLVVAHASDVVDEDPWSDGKPAAGKQKVAVPPDERTFLEKYGLVMCYILLMAGMKVYGMVVGAGAAVPCGGNVKEVHANDDWQQLLQTAKETKQLVRTLRGLFDSFQLFLRGCAGSACR